MYYICENIAKLNVYLLCMIRIYNLAIKTEIYNLVCTTRFWNNFHNSRFHAHNQKMEVLNNWTVFRGARKPKGSSVTIQLLAHYSDLWFCANVLQLKDTTDTDMCDTRRISVKRHEQHLIRKACWIPVYVNKYK